jgi:hypothetical protein
MTRVKLEPIREPTTFLVGPRWSWEDTGKVHVLACGNVPQYQLSRVAGTIRKLLKEFGVPLIVNVDRI